MKQQLVVLLAVLSALVSAQNFDKMIIKGGFGMAGQNKTPELFNDGGYTGAYLGGLEPTLINFGNSKQYELTTDLLYAIKGGMNYSPTGGTSSSGQTVGTGSQTYKMSIRYISIAPCFKFKFKDYFFVKAGPRLDIYSDFGVKDFVPEYDPSANYSFEASNLGISYAAGFCMGKDQIKFICELMGQNDFTVAAKNKASGQSFTNNAYYLNVGMQFALRRE